MRQRAGALLRHGGPGPLRARRDVGVGRKEDKVRGEQGRAWPAHSPRGRRGLGGQNKKWRHDLPLAGETRGALWDSSN